MLRRPGLCKETTAIRPYQANSIISSPSQSAYVVGHPACRPVSISNVFHWFFFTGEKKKRNLHCFGRRTNILADTNLHRNKSACLGTFILVSFSGSVFFNSKPTPESYVFHCPFLCLRVESLKLSLYINCLIFIDRPIKAAVCYLSLSLSLSLSNEEAVGV